MLIYSIGYATYSVDQFIDLLKTLRVTTLIDTRSYPSSKISPGFVKENLKESLQEHGVHYMFLGHLLGGKSGIPYPNKQQTEEYRKGLEIITNLNEKVVAIMCVEPLEKNCHRYYIASDLRNLGQEVITIQPEKKEKKDSPRITGLQEFFKN